MKNHKALYCAFDLFPTSKGASTHINFFAKTLFNTFSGGLLFTLGNHGYLENEYEGNIEIKRFQQQIPNFWERTKYFAIALEKEIIENDVLEVIHFRDIWSAKAVLSLPRNFKTVFEVNSFPSIELPYRYPLLSKKSLQTIEKMEKDFLMKSDKIVVPSLIIQNRLVDYYGISKDKINVIPNGAEPCTKKFEREIEGDYIIYFGAVQKWQGVDDLIKSMVYLKKMKPTLKLVICSSTRPKEAKLLHKLIEKLELSTSIIWYYQLDKPKLSQILQHALASIAPLKENERNIDQGCSPLKILEAMAHKVPVIASNLAVTKEIITDNEDGILIQAERPNELGRTIYLLLSDSKKRESLANNAYKKIIKKYTWYKQTEKLKQVYLQLTENKIVCQK